jgi:hypothetical protein
MLSKFKDAPVHADLAYLEASAIKVAASARAAKDWQAVTAIGTSKAKVEKVASNRRVPRPDGKVDKRMSHCKDPKLQAAPEGLIDPWLRTITFFNGDKPIVQMHYYATHPQSYYGDGRVTYDFPGIARERMQQETGVFQLYFTGCAGNIAAGKYNDGSHENRKVLADRMYAAMKQSVGAVEKVERVSREGIPAEVGAGKDSRTSTQPVSIIEWKVRPLRLPRRNDPEHSDDVLRGVLADSAAKPLDRLKAAVFLASFERMATDRPVELTCLRLGNISILHLPGEPFIEYQLLAQQLRPKDFVAVAGYGDDFTGYICTEKAYAEGGYEPTSSALAPKSESYFRQAIADLQADAEFVRPVCKDVRKIWDAAPHNAFTDLVRWRDRWYCTFREGAGHISDEGAVRVISSADGREWQSVALLAEPGKDLRDPKLSITPDDRLMLLGGTRTPSKTDRLMQSWVAFSTDGKMFSPRQMVADEGQWLWRTTWQKGVAFGVGYGDKTWNMESSDWFSRSYKSADGVHYDEITSFQSYPGLTEASLQFDDSGRMYCVHRRDAGTKTALLGTSDAPYTNWTWRDTGFHFGGPALIQQKGRWWAAGRWVVGQAKTVLARVDFEKGTIEPVLYLHSGGDCSYPGLVASGDELWMSYYSSHEGKAAIYLARIGFE